MHLNNKKVIADCFDNLKNAIILQAVRDYRGALELGDGQMKMDCERFFRSRWYSALTNVDGEYLLRRLQSEKREAKI